MQTTRGSLNRIARLALLPVQHSPLRRWIVLVMALGPALLVGLPASDECLALRAERVRLTDEITLRCDSLDRLPELEQVAARKQALVQERRRRTASLDQTHLFRARIVQLARESGCQVRNVQLGERRSRSWKQGEHPLEILEKPGMDSKEPYVLEAQNLHVALTGPLPQVKAFLSRLHAEEFLMHTRRLALKPGTEESSIALELDLLLLDVTYVPPSAA